MQRNVSSVNRVTIERISLSKETYTVKRPRKIFLSCDVRMPGDVGVNGWGLILQNHSPRQPHACVNTSENVASHDGNIFRGCLTILVSLLKDILSIVTL